MASQPTKSSQKWLLCGSNDIWMTPHFVQSFTLEREICFRASFKFTCTLFALAKGEKRTESTTRPLFYYSKMSRCLQIYFDSVMYLYAKTSIFKDKICCTPEKKGVILHPCIYNEQWTTTSHSCHLCTTASFFCLQGGHCGEVWLQRIIQVEYLPLTNAAS